MSEKADVPASSPPFLPRIIVRFAVLIVLLWVGLTAVVNLAIPQLEVVGKTHSVSLSPKDAAAVQAIKHVGQVFHEFASNSSLTIVLEADKPLDNDAHQFYNELMRKLSADTQHIAHIQDFWSDPVTAGGSQSLDDKAAFVVVYLVGNNETQAYNSVHAVEHVVNTTPAPPGVKAYVTGPYALIADQTEAGDRSVVKVTLITGLVVAAMLLFIYRSVVTTVLVLAIVGIDLGAMRGVVAFLAYHNVFGLSTFATNLLTLLAIAASTDYVIFMLGRYHEARDAGEDREIAFYTMFHGTAHVILGSGLTIAGAMYCLSLARLPYFKTLGAPCAIGMLVAVFAALTLGPAVLTVASSFNLFEPKRRMATRRWRRVGTAIVRWPGPVLAATCAVASIGLLALPNYKTTYDLRKFMSASMPSNMGDAAAGRHFSRSSLTPEVLLLESDHDMRNPVDTLVLDKAAKAIFHSPGIVQVKSITRPLGRSIDHTSIPFIMSMQGVMNAENMEFTKARVDDMVIQEHAMDVSIEAMRHMYDLMGQLVDNTIDMDHLTHDISNITGDLRDHFADFDDFFRPIGSYFYWEKHCFDIPICWAIRSVFDVFDNVDQLSEKLKDLAKDMGVLTVLLPQMRAQLLPMISTMTIMRDMLAVWHSTLASLNEEQEMNTKDPGAMGRVFDAAQVDDSFYLPQSAFDTPAFKRVLNMFLSPDGKAARFIIALEGDPATPEGIARVEPIQLAAKEAIKGTPLQGAAISMGGVAATFKDLQEAAFYDLLIAVVAAISLILIIMMIVTRSLIAAAVIVGTVLLSLGSSFGLSVLVWQDLLGIDLYWLVLAMSVMLLLAVGSDYNLLLISRLKEEIGAGLNTGIIRAMAGTGGVVTAAGMVFAVTMSLFIFSDLRIIGQIGTTIGLGLLFDTLIVRAFMTPSIAALLGRWFWWPQQVRPRPASRMLRSSGPRRLVRALLQTPTEKPAQTTRS
ncbi:MMPL/RND family transporter [Mycobacterium montefiorense]|uniref:Transport protein MmpL2 n=7 Tax=Mycobacterium montefiorense TaxID=154654 RepID=A0AA37PLY1_9MYCO|nr:MMPL family transporter [Mycobacterium montefiorense]GBG37116.1 putative transport protein MmpL2 [Mycobacterium montefiorense]GKU50921.1 putative transport protein MmpL2 [Mycobacterium montefiorense]GKU55961.1 putative transport protein MmpL2 [Mycobacterium montefiorense]GKU69787.1 putative transport protein MmpL2 [Mycobacterium montefiorense]GKU72630.1 putative transport protein MmpL2 [Mycobacterium montefiorense]